MVRMREEYFCLVNGMRVSLPLSFFSISLCTNVCVCTSQAKNDTEKSQNRKKLKLPSSALHRYIAAALLLMAVAHKVILISIGHR